MKKFCTITDKNDTRFHRRISKLLNNGWVLHGEYSFKIFQSWNPLIENCFIFSQALTKEED